MAVRDGPHNEDGRVVSTGACCFHCMAPSYFAKFATSTLNLEECHLHVHAKSRRKGGLAMVLQNLLY